MNQETLGPNRVNFVPIRLLSRTYLPARSWKLSPGLGLHRLRGKLEHDLRIAEGRMRPASNLGVVPVSVEIPMWPGNRMAS